ncbi:hypothetical protein DPMN_026993 [Dreissena polymorpha]|uniref:Uncharacterized protein n=1 Tax=Dreissena polymorpha TaxID=45954 RepID=A0A9D4RF41_DREPO|nr:hypothetical protein DPMN_026992 [Dreissena polymorpha]KAH3863985.1 hypothetical protein DPMN_026993 [Dreissena polymorpha]
MSPKQRRKLSHNLQYGRGRGSFRSRPGFRPRVRAGMSRGGFRGRGAYGPFKGPWPKQINAEGE